MSDKDKTQNPGDGTGKRDLLETAAAEPAVNNNVAAHRAVAEQIHAELPEATQSNISVDKLTEHVKGSGVTELAEGEAKKHAEALQNNGVEGLLGSLTGQPAVSKHEGFLKAVEGKIQDSHKPAFADHQSAIEQALDKHGIDTTALKDGKIDGLTHDHVVEEVGKAYSNTKKCETHGYGDSLKAAEGKIKELSGKILETKDSALPHLKGHVGEHATEEELKGLLGKHKYDKISRTQIEDLGKHINEGMKKEGAKIGDVLKSAESKLSSMTEAGKEAGFVARNFSKDIAANWKGSSGGVKFARGAGVGVGAVIAGTGLSKAFSKDEEGQSHPVAGLLQTGVGAGVMAASLLAKSKGANVSV